MPVSLPETFSQNPAGAEIGLWPLAPGWWIVIVLSVITIIGLVLWYKRYRSQRIALRQALQELQLLSGDTRDIKASCNQILKRAFIYYFNSETIAKLHGEQWQSFLEQMLPEKKKASLQTLLSDLSVGLYRPATVTNSSMSAQEFATGCSQLLKSCLPPTKKQKQALEVNRHD